MSTAAKNAGLAAQNKKISNHSICKASIFRLLDAGVPEHFVMQLSGHKNLQSLSSCKSVSITHQWHMSDTWAEDRWVIKAPRQFANKSFTHRCFKLRARRDQLQIPVPNSAKAKAFSQEQQSAQWTTVFLISFHQARQSIHALMIRSRAALLSSADCRIVAIFLFCTLTELLVLTKFWTFLNMAHLYFVFTFSESLCYLLLFSWANKNFLFWQLSNDCQMTVKSRVLFRSPKQEETI